MNTGTNTDIDRVTSPDISTNTDASAATKEIQILLQKDTNSDTITNTNPDTNIDTNTNTNKDTNTVQIQI